MDSILIYKIQGNLLDVNFMQTHHFHHTFYAANIVFPCIWMNTVRNYDFLRNKIVIKISPPPKPYLWSWLWYAIFSKYFYFVRCSKCQALIKTQKYSCQLYIILGPNKKIRVFRVTWPYLNLLVKPRIFSVILEKYHLMHFERQTIAFQNA